MTSGWFSDNKRIENPLPFYKARTTIAITTAMTDTAAEADPPNAPTTGFGGAGVVPGASDAVTTTGWGVCTVMGAGVTIGGDGVTPPKVGGGVCP